MREAARSELRTLLRIWIAALLASLFGSCCAFAVFIYGLFKDITYFTSDGAVPSGTVPMLIGIGLLLVLVTLSVRVAERFEARCWVLIADTAASAGGIAGDQVLTMQTDGNEKLFPDVRALKARRFSQRLRVLIELAWPDRTGG